MARSLSPTRPLLLLLLGAAAAALLLVAACPGGAAAVPTTGLAAASCVITAGAGIAAASAAAFAGGGDEGTISRRGHHRHHHHDDVEPSLDPVLCHTLECPEYRVRRWGGTALTATCKPAVMTGLPFHGGSGGYHEDGVAMRPAGKYVAMPCHGKGWPIIIRLLMPSSSRVTAGQARPAPLARAPVQLACRLQGWGEGGRGSSGATALISTSHPQPLENPEP